jgi:1-deoxy-D-xylulose-5-phosphate synthase
MVKTARACAGLLKETGITAQVINARFIKPLDEELLKNIASRFGTIVTLEEGNLNCGFGSAVLEFLDQEGLSEKIKLIRAGFPDEFIPNAKREDLLKMYGLDAGALARRITKTLEKQTTWQRSR